MTDSSKDRFVLSYMSEDHYHRIDSDDEMRPACEPERIRGVLAIRTQVERRGQTPCPRCWPENATD